MIDYFPVAFKNLSSKSNNDIDSCAILNDGFILRINKDSKYSEQLVREINTLFMDIDKDTKYSEQLVREINTLFMDIAK